MLLIIGWTKLGLVTWRRHAVVFETFSNMNAMNADCLPVYSGRMPANYRQGQKILAAAGTRLRRRPLAARG